MAKNIRDMIDDIKREALLTSSFTGKKKFTREVMDAMRAVPRDKFVPATSKLLAYENGPLPIGHGQTISQPYIVALMTDLLGLNKEARVLEIGTGCGYQAAVLAQLAKTVYSVEVVGSLAQAARKRLSDLNYTNIETRVGDGYQGWPEHAPYDGIIVTAAAPNVPPALIEQLKPARKMVIPVGLPHSYQRLCLIEKDESGKVETEKIISVAFVPMVATRQTDT